MCLNRRKHPCKGIYSEARKLIKVAQATSVPADAPRSLLAHYRRAEIGLWQSILLWNWFS